MNNSSDIGWGVFFGFLMGLFIMGMIIGLSESYAVNGRTTMKEQAVMMGHAHFKAKGSYGVDFEWLDCKQEDQ